MNRNILHAHLYTRYSSHNQDDGYSIEAQIMAAKKWAESNGIKIEKIYTDQAKTGRNTNRDGYQQMMQAVRNGEIKIIIVHSLDRLHRRAVNQLRDIDEFEKLGVRLVAIKDGIDTIESYSKLLMTVRAAVAEEFSDNLSKETRKGQLVCASQCRHLGGKPPYGYKVNSDGFYEIDETRAPAVRQIYKMYLENMGYSYIISWLKEHGYKTQNGNDFKKNSLNSILKNERYKGTYTWDKSCPKDAEGHRNSHRTKLSYIKIEGGMPAIVSPEMFDAVQNKLHDKSRKCRHYGTKRYYPLNGRICCSCSERMTGNVQHSGKNRYYQYRCSDKCGNKAVNAELLEQSVLYALRECLFSECNQELLLKKLNEISAEYISENNKQHAQLMKRKQGIEVAQNNLLSVLEEGRVTNVIYRKLEQNEAELSQIESMLSKLNCANSEFTESDLRELKNRFIPYMQSNKSVTTKHLLDETIASVMVSDAGITIDFCDGVTADKEVKYYFNGGNYYEN